jgi:hypothetical protein
MSDLGAVSSISSSRTGEVVAALEVDQDQDALQRSH